MNLTDVALDSDSMISKKKNLIEFNSIWKSYGSLSVLSNVSFGVETGSSVAIIGESGSGKTTLLKILCGLVEADQGEVLFNQKSILDHMSEFKKRFGYVTQRATLLPHLTIRKNIQLPAYIHKNTKDLKNRTLALMDILQMNPDDILNKYPFQLSGGQKQRVVIARALINDPDLLIMDEPFSALDSITKNEVYEQFLQIKAHINKTILMVTHDFHEAELMSDKVIILHKSKIAQEGPLSEIRQNPSSKYVKNFIESQNWRMDHED